MKTKLTLILAGVLALVPASAPVGAAPVWPDKVVPAILDRQDFISPDCVELTGWVGRRIAGNAANRLARIDTDRLLEGYRKRPGRQNWDGEHVGKWLHAATLAWVNTGDPALRAKLDATVTALAACQLEDGYLGTYEESKRWTEWDVWAHKYNLIGLLTYVRYTGDAAPLATCRRMADYLLKNLGDDHDLPNMNNVGETCVTVTWFQFNAQLLRLTGEARFAEQLERVVVNQLLGAQQPDCTAWGYYVQMEGRKPYTSTLDAHCCLSSGPRGVALIPSFAISTDADGVVANLYDAGTARLALRDGTLVTVAVETRYPEDGRVRFRVEATSGRAFAVKLRLPAWCIGATVRVNGAPAVLEFGADGYAAVRRPWTRADTIDLDLPMALRVVAGDHLNAGRAALLHGPLVLAAVDSPTAVDGPRVTTLALPGADVAALTFTREPGAMAYRVNTTARLDIGPHKAGDTVRARFVPFAEAGAGGAWYRVWLPLCAAEPQAGPNLLFAGKASASAPASSGSTYAREGADAINDDNPFSFAQVAPAAGETDAWFAVTLPAPASLRRIVFIQGLPGRHGGSFDASTGKPRIQIQRSAGGAWETVGELANHPATTARHFAGLHLGQSFELRLPNSVHVVAVRVIGAPAAGEDRAPPAAACSELQAFPD